MPDQSSTRIRLEFEELVLDRPKKRWNLYFVVASEHPEDGDRFVYAIVPKLFVPVRPPANNVVDFSPDGDGGEGMMILERDMPKDRSISVFTWLMHSRNRTRSSGDLLKAIASMLSKSNEVEHVGSILGGGIPWVAVTKAAFGGLEIVGKVLKRLPDRNLGFLSMGEVFGNEFENEVERDRSNGLSTGFGRMTWTWSASSNAD